MRQVLESEELKADQWNHLVKKVTLTIKPGVGKDPNINNLPVAASENTAIFVGVMPPLRNDIRIYPRDRPVQTTNNLNPMADPMIYLLLFPHVTCQQFYAYRIMQHHGFSILHHSGMLFQQYVVDSYCKAEAIRLWYIRDNQAKLRVEEYQAFTYTIEFQKCGLRHDHMLIIFYKDDKFLTLESADLAEHIFQMLNWSLSCTILSKLTCHVKCGPHAPCFWDSGCCYHFPKSFRDCTLLHYHEFMQYRRPGDGRTCTIKRKVYDNRHFVLYSQHLLLKYQCYINVKLCSSLQATKYIYKYIHRGYDSTTVQPRQKGGFNTISWTQSVSPQSNEEVLCLRLLLHNVRGPTSFQDMIIVRNSLLPTFKEACMYLLLLDQDYIYEVTLYEAATWSHPRRLRVLFTHILFHCNISDPVLFYNHMKPHLIEIGSNDQQAEHFSTCNSDYVISIRHPSLNTDQRNVFNQVMTSIAESEFRDNPVCRAFFIDELGCSGKTFLYNCLIHSLRAKGKICCAITWTGIAYNLLPGGCTSQSFLKLPVPILQNSSCKISAQSAEAEILCCCSLIIWDEAPMALKEALPVIDSMMHDISGKKFAAFGAEVLLLGGDFRQLLPVVRHGGRPGQVNACLKRSTLWPNIRKFHLQAKRNFSSSSLEWAIDAVCLFLIS
ncbi:hypothetical protein PR048_020804 [Dryococelus australis]|uniref:ATP-dependent DNA helicase n=1 Tax=Dryococelus australis TaxID=614101 RepID=A0ABQ9GWH9_9NEOP|nr:hypothetical protein PR048_020804 [Dryococelus australis]